mmetsp:Transcript_11098/g.24468  ORF Transcript_11098/g.24468 Transcript_11098/m.24468 type:complete len:217 (+) Transcript_11098:1582-2232(+)
MGLIHRLREGLQLLKIIGQLYLKGGQSFSDGRSSSRCSLALLRRGFVSGLASGLDAVHCQHQGGNIAAPPLCSSQLLVCQCLDCRVHLFPVFLLLQLGPHYQVFVSSFVLQLSVKPFLFLLQLPTGGGSPWPWSGLASLRGAHPHLSLQLSDFLLCLLQCWVDLAVDVICPFELDGKALALTLKQKNLLLLSLLELQEVGSIHIAAAAAGRGRCCC